MIARLRGVYAITDARLLPEDRLVEGVRQALLGGVAVIQYRQKEAPPAQRQRQAQQLRSLCAAHQCLFIVNDDWKLALDVGADGVHLGRTDGDIADIRQQVPEGFLIGATCHADLDYAMTVAGIADYLAFGRFFPSRTKPDAPPAPISVLTEARRRTQRPLVAIGGVTADNARQLLTAGADMIAVVEAIFGQPDILAATRHLVASFSSDSQGS